MKERPILFSAPMVRAILDGTKTQTRRVVKSRPDKNMGPRCVLLPNELAGEVNAGDYTNCPYGQPGDRLWVRETFHTVDGHRAFYRADYNHNPKGDKEHGIVWTPSIHMPRWASRIALEVTGVRAEPLQDISDADVESEGIQEIVDAGIDHDGWPRDAYRALWEQINGPGSWSANPWVWVIEFKVVEAAK